MEYNRGKGGIVKPQPRSFIMLDDGSVATTSIISEENSSTIEYEDWMRQETVIFGSNSTHEVAGFSQNEKVLLFYLLLFILCK